MSLGKNFDSWDSRNYDEVVDFLKHNERSSKQGDIFKIKVSPKNVNGIKQSQILSWVSKNSTYPFKKCWKVENVDTKLNEVTIKCIGDKYSVEHLRKTYSQREIIQVSDERFHGNLQKGRYLISHSGHYYGQILDIKTREFQNNEKTWQRKLDNPQTIPVMDEEIVVVIATEQSNKRYNTLKKFVSKEELDLNKFDANWFIIQEPTIEEFELKVFESKEKGYVVGLNDTKLIGDSNPMNDSKALIGFDSVDGLKHQKNEMDKQSTNAKAIMAGLGREVVLMKEEFDRQLSLINEKTSLIKKEADKVLSIVHSEMEKVETLVSTLEVFAGIGETVKQIKQGVPAASSIPITLHQMTLFMDEEICILDDDGLDFSNLDLFDEWLASSPEIYKKLLPEEKCVVLMRPRRNMKDRSYLNNPILEKQLEDLDRQCYIAVRNGENIYRIWTSHIETQTKIFPDRSAMEKFFEEVEELNKKLVTAEEEEDSYTERNVREELKKKENRVFSYKRVLILIQGIITRTNIFHPVPFDLNILDEATYKGRINYVYDGSNLIHSGRPSYKEWKEKINSSIVKGSRILFVDDLCPSANNLGKDRFSLQWYHDVSAPKTPNTGLYSVKEGSQDTTYAETKWIPIKEYEKEIAEWKKIRERYKKVKVEGAQEKVSYDVPLEIYQKHMTFHHNWRRHNHKDNTYEVYTVGGFEKVHSFHLDHDGIEYRPTENRKKGVHSYLCISYVPEGKVYAQRGSFSDGSWEKDRTGSIRMKIYPDDKFIINYDALVLEDIDYYLNDRVERADYLTMMPILKTLKAELIREHEEEKQFVKALQTEITKSYPKLANIKEEEIWKVVAWWKDDLVTVWKRPIAKNNTKAWNAIQKQILIQNGLLTQFSERLFCYVSSKKLPMYWFGKVKKDFASAIRESKLTSDSLKMINDNITEVYSGETYDELKDIPNKLIVK